ncbi:MAG TPA: SDR family NAD(P)-dependent oxidoreductase [Burkholderiales bacterium]|nr:SDR family NAD(P)-dependent oxidoreductase [Burkholderiales bacterium]
MDFAGQTVMITGASGNLGRAVAAEFGRRGASLVLVDRARRDLQESEKTLVVEADLLDAAAVERAVDQALQRFGRLHALCNLAGGFRMGPPVHETPERDWTFLLDLNARTVLNTARAVVPRMLEAGGGAIVNVGAYAAQRGAARMGAYTASKSATIRLTEAMSAELRERNINVNCVLPTILDTPENRSAMPEADPRRWVAPQDLARVIAFLASDAARAIHGAALPVTGLS